MVVSLQYKIPLKTSIQNLISEMNKLMNDTFSISFQIEPLSELTPVWHPLIEFLKMGDAIFIDPDQTHAKDYFS